MKIGYARVSTDEQNVDLQRQALEAAGCERIIQDHGVSGAARERAGLSEALGLLGEAMCWWCGSSTGSAGRWRT